MMHSEKFTTAAAALLELQKALGTIAKDGYNPDTKSNYASLVNVVEYLRPKLLAHGFVVVQSEPVEPEPGKVVIDTTLLHVSGEWIASRCRVALVGRARAKDNGGGRYEPDPQASGSAISYARRYGVLAALGLATEADDDGALARQRTTRQERIDAKKKQREESTDQSGNIIDDTIMPVGGPTQRGKPIKTMTLPVLRNALAHCRANNKKAEKGVIAREIARRASGGDKAAETSLRAEMRDDDTLADDIADRED